MANLKVLALRVAVGAAILITAVAAPALAAPTSGLPTSGKLTSCKAKVFDAFGVPVTVKYGSEKGKHPAKSVLSCTNADAVAKAGKQDVLKADGKTGAKVSVGGAKYTLEKYFLGGASDVYTWVGAGVAIYLLGT
jgi:hypothetical protein